MAWSWELDTDFMVLQKQNVKSLLTQPRNNSSFWLSTRPLTARCREVGGGEWWRGLPVNRYRYHPLKNNLEKEPQTEETI